MRRVEILAVGRLRDQALRGLCDDYYRRCSSLLRIEERELRDLAALEQALPARDATLVLLDSRGRQMSSKQFAGKLQAWLSERSRRLVFAIGGADGFNDRLRERASLVLSLGEMTLAHRIVRLVLAEQVYRAVSIVEGAPYHRE